MPSRQGGNEEKRNVGKYGPAPAFEVYKKMFGRRFPFISYTTSSFHLTI
jgi:hypothetical protein